MTNVLLTGGAGFIGTHTANALLAKGHNVRVLDLLDPQIHGKKSQFPPALDCRVDRVRGDVRHPRDLAKALDGIEVVFHLAARTGVGQSQYEVSRYVDTNVGGTATLLQAIVRQKNRVKKLVLASSRAVYGEGAARCLRHGQGHPAPRDRKALEGGDFRIKCVHCGRPMRPVPTAENAPLSPGSIYALTKKHQEDLCLQTGSAHGFSVVILRYFNVYGSLQSLGNPYTGVVTVFFNRLRQGNPISLYEGGLPTRDFVHVSDVVRANLAALHPGITPGSIFNVGSGQAISLRRLALTLGSVLGQPPRLEDNGEYRVGDILACTADLSRSSSLLRYRPRMTLRKGLDEFVQWAKTQKAGPLGGYERTVRELSSHHLFGQSRARLATRVPDRSDLKKHLLLASETHPANR